MTKSYKILHWNCVATEQQRQKKGIVTVYKVDRKSRQQKSKCLLTSGRCWRRTLTPCQLLAKDCQSHFQWIDEPCSTSISLAGGGEVSSILNWAVLSCHLVILEQRPQPSPCEESINMTHDNDWIPNIYLNSHYEMFQALLQKMNQYTHDTLPETNSSPLKIDGWKMILSFWDGPSFQVLCLFVFGRLSHNHLYTATSANLALSNPQVQEGLNLLPLMSRHLRGWSWQVYCSACAYGRMANPFWNMITVGHLQLNRF